LVAFGLKDLDILLFCRVLPAFVVLTASEHISFRSLWGADSSVRRDTRIGSSCPTF
jgi:hypothetical protein